MKPEAPTARDRPDGAAYGTGIRPMERDDLAVVAALFNKAFRNGRSDGTADLARYLEAVFFGSPHYSPEKGSMVHEGGPNGIDSAILSLPMEFAVAGRPVVARLLCAFMMDGKAGAAGAARLARTMRAARQDLCFSDNSSPVSADHWIAGGGDVLPIQSLEWRRSFRPLSAAALTAGRRVALLRSRPIIGTLGWLDRLVRRRKPSVRPPAQPGCRATTASLDDFLACAVPMLQRFSVRPVWSKPEFDWLAGVAALNRGLGELQCRQVVDAGGRAIGAFLFFGQKGRTATVLNIVSEERREIEVVGAMFACLDDEGYAAASGIAQPFLMNAIARQRWLTFKHRGYFCLVTRHAEIREAAMRNDIYIGGLASESWSRLLTDF